MPVRDDAPNVSMKCVITCCLVRLYHAIQGAVNDEYRVVAERRLAGETEGTLWKPHSITTLPNITPSRISCATLSIRGGFTLKLMKLMLVPFTCMVSFHGLSRDPNNILEMNWDLSAHTWEKLVEVLPDLTTILKIYMTLPITSCKTERTLQNYQ
jgi:hypothetical protein